MLILSHFQIAVWLLFEDIFYVLSGYDIALVVPS